MSIYLSGTGLPSPSLLDLARAGAVVFVDEPLAGIDTPFVGCNNLGGARLIARHVIAWGHRRIAIIGGPPRLWTSEQRLAGFRESLAAAGLNPDAMPYAAGDYGERSGYESAVTLLSGPRQDWPTAILCANDLMAIGVMRYCRERGIAIPGELSISGFDDIAGSELLLPALSTVAQPSHDMGHAAAELLLQRIGVRNEAAMTTNFPVSLKWRDSVARIS